MSLLRSKDDGLNHYWPLSTKEDVLKSRYWPLTYREKYGTYDVPYRDKYGRLTYDVPYRDKYGRYEVPYRDRYVIPSRYRVDPHDYFSSYSYDVPSVSLYPSRSLYGRTYGTMSDYGYRLPHTYRSELFGRKHVPYLTEEELGLYYPRYSRSFYPRKGWYL